jgi:hypothetical protein
MAKIKSHVIEEEDEIVVKKGNYEVIEYGGKVLKLKVAEFDEEVDGDRLNKIDLTNLVGEIVTFPVILNRLGIVLAKAEEQLSNAKLDLEIYEAKTKEDLRSRHLKSTVDAKGNEKIKEPTIPELENHFRMTPGFKIYSLKVSKLEMKRDIIKSLYWSAREKSENIKRISATLTRDDLDNVPTSVINGIEILVRNKYIK